MNRRTLIGSVAACACAAAALPAAASAQTPELLSFNHLVVNTSVTPDAQIVTPTTQPATIDADVTTGSGSSQTYTVATTGFSAPTYNFTSPTDGSLTLSLAQPATGTLDPATGALTLTADFNADIVTKNYGSCDQTTGTFTLSTSGTDPLPGKAFPTGGTDDSGFLTGAGAFGGGWSSLPTAGTGTGCAVIDSFVQHSSGGIWFSRNIEPAQATPAKLALSASQVKAVKAGKKASVKVTVKNSGGSATTGAVKVCLSAPKPLKGSKCDSVSTLAAGASKSFSFTVATDKKKHGSYTLKLTASSAKLTSAKASVKLKVTK